MTIDELKAQIDSTIKGNGQRLITGAQLNSILNAIATYTAEVEGVSLKVPQFLPFDSIIANADVQVGSTSATDYEIVYVESKNVFTAYTGGVYYTDWVGSLSYNKGTFSKSAIATNLYINPYAEIYKIENSKLVAIQNNVLRESVLLLSEQSLTSAQKIQVLKNIGAIGAITANKESNSYSGILSYLNMPYYPQTQATKVSFGGGGNVEDKIKEINELSAETKEGFDTFMNGTKVQVTQILDSIANINRELLDEVTRAKQVEMYLESQKADKSGYYENLSVGVSDNLSGRGEATESEFSFRPSGGENKSIEDGTARINSIKGNSVVCNQLCDFKNGEFTFGESSATKENGIYTVTIPSTNTENRVFAIKNSIPFNKHVWLAKATIKSNVEIGITGMFTNGFVANTKCEISALYNSGDRDDNWSWGLSVRELNTEGVLYVYDYEIRDLTKMFGVGSEPTTVEEFESLYGNMPNEYNEGTIIDNHTTAIKSVGVNAWDGVLNDGLWRENGRLLETSNWNGSTNPIRIVGGADYYISFTKIKAIEVVLYDSNMGYITKQWREPNKVYRTPSNAHFLCFNNSQYNSLIPEDNDICVHLVHTGYLNGKYFPYESQTRELPTVEGGLKSAGTAYDEIRYNKSKDKWEHVQRVGSVDLGTLSYEAIGNSVFSTSDIVDKSLSGVFNAISSKYRVKKETTSTIDYVINSSEDKFIRGYYLEGSISRTIYVKDTAYTDVATFKQAMQGVILYYELATPIVTELDVDISPDYKVWDYGTEEAISEVLSTPARINANYGFNAVGQITDNTELIKKLLARVAVLEAQVAQANSANVEPIEPIVE